MLLLLLHSYLGCTSRLECCLWFRGLTFNRASLQSHHQWVASVSSLPLISPLISYQGLEWILDSNVSDIICLSWCLELVSIVDGSVGANHVVAYKL